SLTSGDERSASRAASRPTGPPHPVSVTMHEDELALAPDLAQHLVLSLLPDASPAEIREVETSATTHRIVRIGASLTARFPRLRTAPLHARNSRGRARGHGRVRPAQPLPLPGTRRDRRSDAR